MNRKLHFTKMHGIGNDYIFVDYRQKLPKDIPKLARKISRHHFAIGSDGLILIGQSSEADCSMRIFNADGSEAEMCGNGLRCVAKYAHDRQFVSSKDLKIATKAGVMEATIIDTNGAVSHVAVSLPEPGFSPETIPIQSSEACLLQSFSKYKGTGKLPPDLVFTAVNVGNPHCIIVIDEDLADYPVKIFGPIIENLSLFPEKTNVEFVRILTPEKIQVRVWERGSGETLACGSGACASVAACFANKISAKNCTVILEGGELKVNWNEGKGFNLEGPAEEVFEGAIPFDFLEQD